MTTDNSTPVILPLQPNAPFEQARSLAFSAGRPLPYETVPLAEALGRNRPAARSALCLLGNGRLGGVRSAALAAGDLPGAED